MKKLFITTVLALVPFFTFAQSPFDKFDDKDGISSVIINENLFNLLGEVEFTSGGDSAKKYLDKAKEITDFRMYSTKDRVYAQEMKTAVADYLKKNKMEQLMSVKDEGTRVKIYVKTGKDDSLIKEFLLFTENPKDNETVILTFTGNVDLKKM